MRYDENLTKEAVHEWAIKHFKGPIEVYAFRKTFVAVCKEEVVNVHCDTGSVEVEDR